LPLGAFASNPSVRVTTVSSRQVCSPRNTLRISFTSHEQFERPDNQAF
jgi:hypothetical protein